MADYDWGQPERQAPRGGGRSWLWLLLGIGVLLLILNSRAQQPPPQQPDRPPARVPVEPTQAQRPLPTQRKGDWSLEEVPGRPTARVPAAATTQSTESANPAPPKKTAQGDWQIEEVTADGKTSDAADSAKENAGDPARPPSKTTEGDWTIEEVKPKQSPDSEK